MEWKIKKERKELSWRDGERKKENGHGGFCVINFFYVFTRKKMALLPFSLILFSYSLT